MSLDLNQDSVVERRMQFSGYPHLSGMPARRVGITVRRVGNAMSSSGSVVQQALVCVTSIVSVSYVCGQDARKLYKCFYVLSGLHEIRSSV